MVKQVIFYLLLLQLSGAVFADPDLNGNILDHRDSVKIEILKDPHNTLNIQDINSLEISSKFKTFSNGSFNFGFDTGTIWIRISFKDKNNIIKYLEVDNPFLDLVRLYTPADTNTYSIQEAGDSFPFDARPNNYRTFVFNLDQSSNRTESVTYFIQIKSTATVSFLVSLWTRDKFLSQIENIQTLIGFYFGLVIVMGLYNLFIYFNIREKTHLFYVIYIVCFLLFIGSKSGVAFQYLWPNNSAWAQISSVFFAGLASFTGIMFAREFLRSWEHTPKLDKVMLFIMGLTLIEIFISLIGELSLALKISIGIGICLPPLILISGILAWISGYRPARFLVIAWSFFLVTILIGGFMLTGVLPATNFTSHAMQIGSAVEVVLLSWALADRMAILKQEKEEIQFVHLHQLEHHNQLLEQQVLERTAELEALNALANDRSRILEKTNAELKDMATKDGLTGLLNHHTFIDHFKRLIEDAKRYRYDFSVLLLDIDNFKYINDSYGHLVGNKILLFVADRIRHQIRESDIAVRFGGEEFVVVLSRASLSESTEKAETIRKEIEQLTLEEIPNLKCTVSIGVITTDWNINEIDYNDTLKQADAAMYQAKEMGKNRVHAKKLKQKIISLAGTDKKL